MAFDTRSFCVGIATVLGILAVGFGGGVMMGGVMSGADTKTPNKVERQAKDSAPDTKEIKPALQPVVVSPAAPAAPAPAPAEAAAAASAAASASASEPVPAQAAPAPP